MTTTDLITTQRAVLDKLQDLRSLATANIDPRAKELTVLCAHAQQVLNKLVEIYPQEPEEKKYRMLDYGEVIQEGDEFQSFSGKWIKSKQIGKKVDIIPGYRRPLTSIDLVLDFAKANGVNLGGTLE